MKAGSLRVPIQMTLRSPSAHSHVLRLESQLSSVHTVGQSLDISLERALGHFCSVPSPMCPRTLTHKSWDLVGLSSLKNSSWKKPHVIVFPSGSWEVPHTQSCFVVTEGLFVHQPNLGFAAFSHTPGVLYHL